MKRVFEALRSWWFWEVSGFPFKRVCPQCAGSGKYLSEMSARYGDKPDKCQTCKGMGKVRRWNRLNSKVRAKDKNNL